MATMGELLFYVSTQQDNQEGVTAQQVVERWGINPTTITAVTRYAAARWNNTCK